MMRRVGLITAWLVAASLAGCAAGSLIDIIDQVDDGDHDIDTAAEVRALLSRAWDVRSYTGAGTGAVTVPDSADLIWRFDNDGTYELISNEPVVDESGTRVYDEAGTWRVVSPGSRSLELTATRRDGDPVPADERLDVGAVWSKDATSLVVTTAAIGPGTVRYVMGQ